jgi:hypothetical protein
MKKNRVVQFLLLLIYVLISCKSGNDSIGDDSINLGSHYYSVNPQILIPYREPNDGVGDPVIPAQVLKFGFNKNEIIVQTSGFSPNLRYWLIDKTSEGKQLNFVDSEGYYKYTNVVGPLDSLSFYKMLGEKKINLKFNHIVNK